MPRFPPVSTLPDYLACINSPVFPVVFVLLVCYLPALDVVCEVPVEFVHWTFCLT